MIHIIEDPPYAGPPLPREVLAQIREGWPRAIIVSPLETERSLPSEGPYKPTRVWLHPSGPHNDQYRVFQFADRGNLLSLEATRVPREPTRWQRIKERLKHLGKRLYLGEDGGASHRSAPMKPRSPKKALKHCGKRTSKKKIPARLKSNSSASLKVHSSGSDVTRISRHGLSQDDQGYLADVEEVQDGEGSVQSLGGILPPNATTNESTGEDKTEPTSTPQDPPRPPRTRSRTITQPTTATGSHLDLPSHFSTRPTTARASSMDFGAVATDSNSLLRNSSWAAYLPRPPSNPSQIGSSRSTTHLETPVYGEGHDVISQIPLPEHGGPRAGSG